MNKQYVVTLTDEERQSLRDLVSRGKASARAIEHALILLKADVPEDATDEEISQACEVSVRTIERVRKRFVEDGLEAALRPPKVPGHPASSTARWRPTSWLWPAPTRPGDGVGGRSACWPRSWSRWGMSTRSPTRACGRL